MACDVGKKNVVIQVWHTHEINCTVAYWHPHIDILRISSTFCISC